MPMRRRERLALLASACERGATASIALRSASPTSAAGRGTLLALEDDGLIVGWPQSPAAPPATTGVTVEVCFSMGGQSFRFRSLSRGRVEHSPAAQGAIAALRLALPLRIDPAERRIGRSFFFRRMRCRPRR